MKDITTLPDGKICRFYNVRKEPFSLHGLFEPYTQESFNRIPLSLVKKLSPGFCGWNHPSGGRIRFATNSSFIRLRVKILGFTILHHLSICSANGFDLYANKCGIDTYVATFNAPVDVNLKLLKIVNGHDNPLESVCEDGFYEAQVNLSGDGKMREYTINMPVFSVISEVYVGLEDGAQICAHKDYKVKKPVVFYGSSITHGACASRPGLIYESIISRKLDCDFINLGFSGSAKGEKEMAEHIAGLEMSAFVMDYDHNAPSAEHLHNTHYDFYKLIRDAKPNTPIIIVTRPDGKFVNSDVSKRRDAIYKTYSKAISDGDKNVYFIDGMTLFDPEIRDDCTTDGTHPNDLGFMGMARGIGTVLKAALCRAGEL